MSLQARKDWRALIELVWAAAADPERADVRMISGAARDAGLHPPPVEGASATAYAKALIECAKGWSLAADDRRVLLFNALMALADAVWRLMEEAREASIPHRVGLDD